MQDIFALSLGLVAGDYLTGSAVLRNATVKHQCIGLVGCVQQCTTQLLTKSVCWLLSSIYFLVYVLRFTTLVNV